MSIVQLRRLCQQFKSNKRILKIGGNAVRTIRLYMQNQALRALVEASLPPYVEWVPKRFMI